MALKIDENKCHVASFFMVVCIVITEGKMSSVLVSSVVVIVSHLCLSLTLSFTLPSGPLSSVPVWCLFCRRATTLMCAVGQPWRWAFAVLGRATR